VRSARAVLYPSSMTTTNRDAALRELRVLVATYLEGSDDAARATELLDALDARNTTVLISATTTSAIPDDRARSMFGCTATAIDEALTSKEPRDIAMYAMGTLSNAQEYIRCNNYEAIEWSVADRDANALRQLINIAKYAIDKAVPR
jgi:hypothetical protein